MHSTLLTIDKRFVLHYKTLTKYQFYKFTFDISTFGNFQFRKLKFDIATLYRLKNCPKVP
jgi:hypothetical protein